MQPVEIAEITGGKVYGNKKIKINSIKPPEHARPNDITFLFDTRTKTKAGVVVAQEKISNKVSIVVDDTRKAMFLLLKKLSQHKRKKSISPRSSIDKAIHLPRSCTIEPFAVINPNVRIGIGTYIGAHSYIDKGVIIGQHCEIYPHTILHSSVVIGDHCVIQGNSVIGKAGFGFIKSKRYQRIPHIGGVLIESFVEIGSNVTIDRGTIGSTIIGQGTKIDNLVDVAHNVRIGKNCIIMGQCGIAGSSVVGNNVTLCGQVGVSDHVCIGDNTIVYAKSAVLKSIPGKKKYSGIPAREHETVLRALARLYRNL